MFKSQNVHNLYFCCNRCNSLTFMLDYDEDFKRFKSKLFTKLTTGRPWPTPWPRPWPVPHVLSLPKMHGEYCYCRLLVSQLSQTD